MIEVSSNTDLNIIIHLKIVVEISYPLTETNKTFLRFINIWGIHMQYSGHDNIDMFCC